MLCPFTTLKYALLLREDPDTPDLCDAIRFPVAKLRKRTPEKACFEEKSKSRTLLVVIVPSMNTCPMLLVHPLAC